MCKSYRSRSPRADLVFLAASFASRCAAIHTSRSIGPPARARQDVHTDGLFVTRNFHFPNRIAFTPVVLLAVLEQQRERMQVVSQSDFADLVNRAAPGFVVFQVAFGN
jgi:hypothetical protein